MYCGLSRSRNRWRWAVPGRRFPAAGGARGAGLVDAETAVQARIVDVALPAHGGARLLEVHAHDDEQVVGQRVGRLLELARVLHGLFVVVDGAGADHHHQPVVAAVQHVGDARAAVLPRPAPAAAPIPAVRPAAGRAKSGDARRRCARRRCGWCLASRRPGRLRDRAAGHRYGSKQFLRCAPAAQQAIIALCRAARGATVWGISGGRPGPCAPPGRPAPNPSASAAPPSTWAGAPGIPRWRRP